MENLNKLEESENLFKKIFENSSIGIGILGVKGNFLKVNDFFSKIIGYSENEIYKLSIEEITYQEDIEQYNSYIKLLENNLINKFDMDIRLLNKENKLLWLKISISIIKENNEKLFLVLVEDITEKKEAQFELLLKKMELEEVNQNLEHFAYYVSHDLQEPLRNINKLILELQKHDELKENEAIDNLFSYSKRMRHFISDLLIYAQAGKKLKLGFIDTNVVLDRVLENLNVLIKENNTEIIFELLPDINFNALRLEQIFQNLISNAIKYRKKDINPIIEIYCIEEEYNWKFIIKDNGVGIESEHFKDIFQVFSRGYQEYKNSGSGSGIGLAVCKKIIDQHGGKIWLESEINVGTTFYFTIPYNEN